MASGFYLNCPWSLIKVRLMESQCPKCSSENIYQDGLFWICPECSNEWNPLALKVGGKAQETQGRIENDPQDLLVRDSSGNLLQAGDSIVVMKDLKIKGTSSTIKSGTKVRNIKVQDMGDGHNIAGKVDGLGFINLKSEFVKKV